MNIADEATGSHLKAHVHEEKRIAQISLKDALDVVNKAFQRWGLPENIKIDNGKPLVNPHYRDIPSKAKLWWIGLGIKVVQNPPRCPQENGIVECLQGTCKRWVNPISKTNIQELQKALDDNSDFQRNHYEIPSKNFNTRIQLYPKLETNLRVYNPQDFDIKKVDDYLSKKTWKRRIKSIGSVHFFGQQIYIGKKFGRMDVYITFDPIERQWIFRSDRGVLLNTSKKSVPSEKEIFDFATMSKN